MTPDADTQRWIETAGRALRTHYGVDQPTSSSQAPDPRFAPEAPYCVVREVARGGMGRVLRVVDTRLERTLAMKVPLSDAGADAARLLAEARLLGRLQHPGIVPVHDVGTDADGRPYFTMQLVAGESLADLLARRGTESVPTRFLEVVAQVCDTIAFAHEQGVVHRDLKPGNVMLGQFGAVYVLDWGIAGEATAAPDAGTPAYMAPEQARGEAGGPATDVYALGAILREVVTGSPRADGPAPRAARHAPLFAICRRAMAVDPAQRYPSVAALALDLRAFLDGRVVQAWRSGPLAELAAWHRRHRAIATTALAAAFALASLATWFVLRLGRERDRAAKAADAAQASLREVDELSVSERVDDLRRRGDGLWPLAADLEPHLRAWLDEAAALRPVRAALEARLRQAEASVGMDPPPDLAWRWRQRLLARTVHELAAFADAVPATPFADTCVGAVAARLEVLAALRRRADDGDVRRRWQEAADAVRADPRFASLQLRPQFDLLPLGRDAASGLLEFAHLPSGVPPRRAADGRLQLAPDSSVVLVLLPGGTFTMGAQPGRPPNRDDRAEANECPVHDLTLAPFLLAKFELTQAQWQRAFGANPSNHDGRSLFVDAARAPLHPVENVTWLECRTLLLRLGLDLPTEAQWEYAARCGEGDHRAEGEALAEGARPPMANLADRTRARALGAQCPAHETTLDDGFVMHAPVGSFAPNAWGLHDVFGNVWEWCRDEYRSYETPARSGDGARPCDPLPQLAIYRGGAFDTLAVEARAANRAGAPPDVRQFTVGLRPARRLDLGR